MPRRNFTKRARAYRKYLERRACERQEELRELEQELRREWREQQHVQAVDTPAIDGERLLNPLEAL
jgi:hypothetical protein